MAVKEINRDYEKIAEWLKNHGNKEFFTIDDIVRELGLKRGTVNVFIHRRTQKGLFEKRVKDNRHPEYRMIPSEIHLELPKGLLSDEIFEILKEYGAKFPNAYVTEELLMEKVNRRIKPRKVCGDSIHAVVYRWYKDGVLLRNDHIRGSGYRLKDVTQTKRPVTCD